MSCHTPHTHQGLAAVVARVELLGRVEVVEPARVVHVDGLPRGGDGARALLEDPVA